MKKQPIGLILARGGSKGIPHKNLQEILGQSLIYRCARQAVQSRLSEVFVYSDSSAIRVEAVRAGATPVERPEQVSGDAITSEDTVCAFLDQVPGVGDRDLCLIQCTTPFLRTQHIDLGIERFYSRHLNVQSVVSVCECNRYLGYQKIADARKRQLWTPVYPYRWLRQENEPLYYMENGGFYLATNACWRKQKRIALRCGMVVMDWWESIEIDEPEDLEVARRLATMFLEK